MGCEGGIELAFTLKHILMMLISSEIRKTINQKKYSDIYHPREQS